MARQSLTLIEASGTSKLGVERETGFEPATDGLGSRCATTALLPLCLDYPLGRGSKSIHDLASKRRTANRFLPTFRRYSRPGSPDSMRSPSVTFSPSSSTP